jgi:hypothetical protein
MSYELRLKTRFNDWAEINKLKEAMEKTIKDRKAAETIVRSCSQKLPKLQEQMFKQMEMYNKTW